MADRGDTHYRVRGLNTWFAIGSLLLLIAAVWMVIDDWNRPWKRYQREFRDIETERAEAELRSAEARAAMDEEERLQEELERRREELASQQDVLSEAEAELVQLQADQFVATEAEKKAKQEYNWERFLAEEERIHTGDPTAGEARLREMEERLFARTAAKKEADAKVREQEQEIEDLRSAIAAVEDDLRAATKDIDLVRKKLARLDPEDAPTRIANFIRDFPGLDFIGPKNEVRKVVLEDLTFELNFTKKRRIDMCMTCHMAIDRAGFDEYEEPHRSHPRLDLFLSAKSPHPINEVGCTICHRGAGEALDFQRADHRPSDPEEAERWYEEYHWHKQHYWDYPMLSSRYIEASCVQCHEDSMELIADEAPKVAEGYRLFERYGCYSCHKVEWFPTSRRPGPSLANVRQKTTKDFVDAWVTKPKSFRPTTWMPQIFHLENYGPEDEIARAEYGEGRVIMGDEWSDAAVAAVSAFVWSRSGDEELPPIPVEGDAERGREVFRLTGCLACHNMAPYTEEERAEVFDLAQRERETNEHGPNLRGLATKVEPEWLYAWIKDPTAYWPGTRMPDLRLSDQEAADVVAYVFEDPDGVFHDVPEGWQPGEVAYERDVLEEQARWFFNRTLPSELERRFETEWSDDDVLLEAVGERWVLNQGCHSCHEIPGLENAQPIGTELTNWGSKVVEKLDFGFMPEILAEEHGWSYHETEQFKEYRENFLEQKLESPRSYDRRKIKNPTERLRMPWFDFDREEIEAISTFVVGLVDDEVQRAEMVPDADESAMDTGMRVVRQKNCASCHLIEPGTIEFLDEEGDPHEVRGQILPLDPAYDLLPPPLEDFQDYVAGYEEYMEDELDEVIVQLLEPEPGLGEVGSTVVVEDVGEVRASPPWGGDMVSVIADYYLYEDDVEDVDGERRSYVDEPYEKVRWTFAPPVLTREGAKVQRDWFYRFLLDPVPLRQQLRVRMPSFTWREGEAAAVADYFANAALEQWPRRYARKLLLGLDVTPAEVEAEAEELGTPSISAEKIRAIVAGARAETESDFPKLLAYGEAKGFETTGPVSPSYDAIPQRAPTVLDPILEEDPEFFDDVHRLVVEGPNCVQCHFLGGEAPNAEGPIAWAPDLDVTRERLRPDWVREWLQDPSRIYPGTSMPANFPADELVWQEFLPLPSDEQIEAVLIWLFNLDRALLRN